MDEAAHGRAATKLIRVPVGVLPPPATRELPEPMRLRRMLGPSIILAGLSIGSGEFVLWPRLTAEWGYSLFWACWIGVTIQYFLNMEIERWSLAVGESAVTGFIRLGRIFGPVFLVCATLPWVWPGWATGAAQLLVWELGSDSAGAVTALAIAGLVLCGATLSLGPVVYRTVEVIQFVLVTAIFVFVVILATQIVSWEAVRALAQGALRVGQIPEGVDAPLLLGALAFAGAGGSVNLAQSNYVMDKGYGMGHWIGRITSPFTGREEAVGDVGVVFEGTPEELARWRVWWRRSNVEHFFSFYLLCLISLALFSLIAGTLLGGEGVREGFAFIRDEAQAIEARFGTAGRQMFLGAGILVLFSTELALLDAVSRVIADIVKVSFLRGHERWSRSRIYFASVWGLIAFGVAVLAVGFDQPLVLLVLSASLNGVVMFLYSGLLLWLNLRTFRGPLRPHPVRVAALLGAFAFFGYFSVRTLADLLAGGS